VLSYFLEGKAYDFYVQKVSLNEAQWSITDFYTGLFNFCFPINYRMQMRKKLNKYYQNDKTILEYVHGLEELFNIIGSVTKREMVLKFWNGSRHMIQKALWRDGLNPEVSTWEEVIEQAEIIEISESVVDQREHKDKKGKPSSGGGGSNSNDYPPKPKSNGSINNQFRGSSRAPFRGSSSNRPFNRDSRHPRMDRNPSQTSTSRGNNFQKGLSREYPKNSSRAPTELNDKEKAERRAAGLCFGCNKPGHFERNCPKGSTVKSSGSRPPGAAMFNMELLPVDEIPNDDDHIEILDSLPLGSISFLEDPYAYNQICETPEKETSYWANIPRIGDAYTQAIN